MVIVAAIVAAMYNKSHFSVLTSVLAWCQGSRACGHKLSDYLSREAECGMQLSGRVVREGKK